MSGSKKINSLSSKKRLVLTGMKEELGKMPPQALDLEESILGAVMLDKNTINKVAGKLVVDSFYRDSNQRIYKAFLGLWNDGEPIDILTVTQKLRELGDLEMVGGAFYISKLTARVNGSENIDYYVKIVLQNALKRQMITLAADVLNEAYEDQTDIFELIDGLMLKLNNINKDISSLGTKGRAQHAKELREDVEKARNGKDLSGVPSGLKTFDKSIGRFKGGNVYVFAGRPGMGKTADMLSKVIYQLNVGERVAVFSVEMPGKQMIARMCIQDLKLYSGLINEPLKLNDKDYQRLLDRIDYYENLDNFLLCDKAGITPNQARAILLDFNPTIAYFDYLQIMKGDNKYNNREATVADISGSLKILAKDFDIPVIELAQLSREVEKRPNKIPQLSDLRESGAIEQDADLVVFLYRPKYYKIENSGYKENAVVLMVGKNRHGADDLQLEVEFVAQTMTVRDFEDDDEIPEELKPREVNF